MSALDDLKASKAVYDQASADMKAKLAEMAGRVTAIDPKAPDAEQQVAAIEAERTAYYDTAKADLKAKFNVGIDAASRVRDPDVAEGQAVLDTMTQDLKSVRASSDAVKDAEANKLADVFAKPPGPVEDAAPASPDEVKSEVAAVPGWKDVPGVPGARMLTVQSDGLFKSATSALPPAASAALASASQKSSELMRAVGGQGTAKTVTPQNAGSSLTKPNKTTEDFMMKLKSKQTNETIIFNVTPTIDESRSANYEHISPVHHPGTIQVYKNTEARQFNVGVKMIARTAEEASKNLKYLNWIRSWVMPYYGQGTAGSSQSNRLGAPPDILMFDVYGDKNIANVPVVLTSYHWVYPDTCDYIPTKEGIPFPTIMDISLSLIESYSPEEYSNFNIVAYKDGDMLGAYTFSSTPSSTEESGT